MRAVVLAATLAALPVTAEAQWCSPNPLAWPFCAAGAVVVGATQIVAAPFVIIGGGYGYGHYGYPPPYYPPPAYYQPTPIPPPVYYPVPPPVIAPAPVAPVPQGPTPPMYYSPRG
jgi:hypothetical protein